MSQAVVSASQIDLDKAQKENQELKTKLSEMERAKESEKEALASQETRTLEGRISKLEGLWRNETALKQNAEEMLKERELESRRIQESLQKEVEREKKTSTELVRYLEIILARDIEQTVRNACLERKLEAQTGEMRLLEERLRTINDRLA